MISRKTKNKTLSRKSYLLVSFPCLFCAIQDNMCELIHRALAKIQLASISKWWLQTLELGSIKINIMNPQCPRAISLHPWWWWYSDRKGKKKNWSFRKEDKKIPVKVWLIEIIFVYYIQAHLCRGKQSMLTHMNHYTLNRGGRKQS